MAYDTIGIGPRPLGGYLPQMCNEIKQAGGGLGFEANIVSALVGNNNIAPNRFVKDVHVEEILTISGNVSFPSGSNQMGMLQHLVFLLLAKAGFHDQHPAAIENRIDARLTMDEVVDRMMTSLLKFPLAEHYGGTDARWSSFVALIPRTIRQFIYAVNERPAMVERLRRKAQDVGWKYLHKANVTQEEKSLFLLIAPGHKRAVCDGEDWAALPPLYPAENGDPLVDKAFALYTESVSHGPYSKYLHMSSTKVGNSAAFYLGPKPHPMVMLIGYQENRGMFLSYSLETSDTVNWSDESQLRAVQEREATILGSAGADPFTIEPPVQSWGAAGTEIFTEVDEPEFELSYSINATDEKLPPLSAFDVDYHCLMTGRLTSTSTGTFPGPMMLIYDRIYTGKPFGDGAVRTSTLMDYPLIDPRMSPTITTSTEKDPVVNRPGMQLFEPEAVLEQVFWPDPRQKKVFAGIVNMTPLYYKKGKITVLPPFREHVLVPRSWLFEERTEEVSFITGKLGFNEFEKLIARESLTVSHNSARLGAIFPSENLPGLLPSQIAAIYIM